MISQMSPNATRRTNYGNTSYQASKQYKGQLNWVEQIYQ